MAITPDKFKEFLLHNKFEVNPSTTNKRCITIFVNDKPFLDLDFEKALEIAKALETTVDKALEADNDV